MQHLTRFNQINIYIFPIQAILDDLSTGGFKWKVYGDQIIIMGDINAYVESKYIKDLFDRLGMRELIIKLHVKTGPDITRGGGVVKAIDYIWGTRGVNIIAGGYLSFRVGVILDHRILSIKIYHEYIFGSSDPPTRRPMA